MLVLQFRRRSSTGHAVLNHDVELVRRVFAVAIVVKKAMQPHLISNWPCSHNPYHEAMQPERNPSWPCSHKLFDEALQPQS